MDALFAGGVETSSDCYFRVAYELDAFEHVQWEVFVNFDGDVVGCRIGRFDGIGVVVLVEDVECVGGRWIGCGRHAAPIDAGYPQTNKIGCIDITGIAIVG